MGFAIPSAFKISEFLASCRRNRASYNFHVHCSSSTRIGGGESPLCWKSFRRKWNGLEVVFLRDDIRKPTNWKICDSRHAVVVHLGGHVWRLETELDGFDGSCEPALPGEVWTTPAERRYASHACGTSIHYAVALAEPDAPDVIARSHEADARESRAHEHEEGYHHPCHLVRFFPATAIRAIASRSTVGCVPTRSAKPSNTNRRPNCGKP
jgi:hypothetical protein